MCFDKSSLQTKTTHDKNGMQIFKFDFLPNMFFLGFSFCKSLPGWLLERYPDAAKAYRDLGPAIGEPQPVLRSAL